MGFFRTKVKVGDRVDYRHPDHGGRVTARGVVTEFWPDPVYGTLIMVDWDDDAEWTPFPDLTADDFKKGRAKVL